MSSNIERRSPRNDIRFEERLPRNDDEEEAPIDAGVLVDDTITTGMNGSLILLLINGLISFLWGLALVIFALGFVPLTWSVSEYGRTHAAIINVFVTLVASTTASTTHLKFTSQGILKHYSQYVLVDGFTVGQLAWMQGIKEWSLFTDFGSWKTRVAWLVIYTGMALHSASVVSILQPDTFYMHVPFNDAIPCGTNPNKLTLDVSDSLPPDIQAQIDQLSFEIGLQIGSYSDQVGGNTTTSVAGRVYVKDSYAYGAIGGLSDGLQEIPGALFSAQCADGNTSNTASLSDLWSSVFPGRALPTISNGSNGFQSFSDSQPVPPQVRSVVSDQSFQLKSSQIGMYALVNPSGSGGLVTVDATGDLLSCVWNATQILVSVQTVESIAKSLGGQYSSTVPQLTGRAVFRTLQGMAAAVHLGADLDNSKTVGRTFPTPSISTMLQTLLADGGKAALTVFNVYFWNLFRTQGQLSPAGISVCNSNNRTVASHWRFSNSHNLGWVAVIWTILTGILAIVAVMWFTPRPRARSINPLEVPYTIVLGKVVIVYGRKNGEQLLKMRLRNLKQDHSA